MIKFFLQRMIKKPGLIPLILIIPGLFITILAVSVDYLGMGSSNSTGMGPTQQKMLTIGMVLLIPGIFLYLPAINRRISDYFVPLFTSMIETSYLKNLDAVLSRAVLFIFGCIFAILVAEIVLRAYNPFILRIKGDMIDLPRNLQLDIENPGVEKLDDNIVHSKNSLGFRGDDPPINFNDYLTIVTVGGSTTECYYLSDGKTWSDALKDDLEKKVEKVWVNNAGLDGHSTFGHAILMRDYINNFHPDFVFYLIGLNDMAINTPRSYEEWIVDLENDIGTEKEITKPKSQEETGVPRLCLSSFGCFIESVAPYSNLANLIWNLTKANEAYRIDMGHNSQLDITSRNTIVMDEAEVKLILEEYQKEFIPNYKSRVEGLVQTCFDHGIEPVLITQPVLFGKGVDDVTGVNLETIDVNNTTNGKVQWEILELYNEVLREVAEERGILLIDLAEEMPKSSQYYYDFYHYTNEGAQVIGQILADDFYPYLLETGYINQ